MIFEADDDSRQSFADGRSCETRGQLRVINSE